MTRDTLGFLDTVAGLPEQLAAAHERASAVDADALPAVDDVQNVLLLGVGGSGVTGDVVAAVGHECVPVPLVVCKHPRIPAWVGPGTLAVAVSYSGETVETVEAAAAAADRGARLVVVSVGGALADLAEQHEGLHIPAPSGLMPRAALGALVAPVLVTLYRSGILPEAHAWLVRAQEQLSRRRDRCVPAVEGAANPARELARRIDRTVPLVHGAGPIGAVAAYRWKCDVNENAKAPAFANVHPELTHNEICGWGQHGDATRQLVTVVELRHGFEHPRDERGIDAAREIVEEAVHQVLRVEAQGEGELAQALDLAYLGDWVSCYLALDHDVDPGPIDAIDRLKRALAD